ncbi:MOSC domain-containing protein [Undibacterium luofuense]|uniref:MOSC domain-containing protein n=1 Tax=Undibacterium luofuense TaxID=2828733 RepID=UPI0030EDA603
MPVITELFLYPVKSCAGISLTEAEFGENGLSVHGITDRSWMIVTQEGMFMTQRELPKMATIRPAVSEQGLVLQHDEMPDFYLPPALNDEHAQREVTVWDFTGMARDAGDEAAAWCTQVLGQPCRLVQVTPATGRTTSGTWTDGVTHPVQFQDGYPYLLTSVSSLAELNRHAQQAGWTDFPGNRFRPNIVIDDQMAFEEDHVTHYHFENGLSLHAVKPCTRCPIPAVDQDTGISGNNPVDLLQQFHCDARVEDQPVFGMNCVLQNGKGLSLRVGDTCQAELSF